MPEPPKPPVTPPADPPLTPPADPPTPPTKKDKKDSDDSAIFTEILNEYKSKVSAEVATSIEDLSVGKQIKILKGIITANKAAAVPKKKDKKIKVKPAEVEEGAPPIVEDEIRIAPLVERFKNREEWFEDFMGADKLYFKGHFNKTG